MFRTVLDLAENPIIQGSIKQRVESIGQRPKYEKVFQEQVDEFLGKPDWQFPTPAVGAPVPEASCDAKRHPVVELGKSIWFKIDDRSHSTGINPIP